MSWFFFDLVEAAERTHDFYGEELADLNEAIDHAQAIIAQVMREQLPNGAHVVCVCEVRDERDKVVYRASLTFDGERPAP